MPRRACRSSDSWREMLCNPWDRIALHGIRFKWRSGSEHPGRCAYSAPVRGIWQVTIDWSLVLYIGFAAAFGSIIAATWLMLRR